MLVNYLGRLLFPGLQPWQYRPRFKIIAAAVTLGMAVGGILAAIMILHGKVGK
jgi:hypothetical protein